jgi:hypothetical protein
MVSQWSSLRRKSPRAYPLLIELKAGSKFLFYRASLPENRFALLQTRSETSPQEKAKDAHFSKA